MSFISTLRARLLSTRGNCRHCEGSGKAFDRNVVGPMLREARERRQVAARSVARRMGITPSYISDLELGRRDWSPALVARYLTALEADHA